MLQLLHIENIAVIERADISFRAGFNALTGETGAGKSIVIDSLGAVLGARTSRDLIRTGAAKAFVSAEFDGVDTSLPVLAALGVEPEDGVLLLQRDIYADGKNICRANGRPITVAQLRALGTSLLNIHGQHEGTQLLDEEQHGAYLDRFARLDGLPEAYTERYQAARETRRQIEALEMDEAEKARRVDTLRHQIAELERAELRDGEEEELLARRELLRNAEKFMDAFAAADYALSGGDDGLGAASQLKNAENALHSVRALGARFSELCERLESLYSDVYDLAETVRDLRSEMDFSPQELDAVESRADQLYRLKKSTARRSARCSITSSAVKRSLTRSNTRTIASCSFRGRLPSRKGNARRGAHAFRRAQGCGKSARGAHSAGAARAGHEQGPLFHRLYRA
ncbi:MAG: AAA family ATPase [Oscillospiraceae bacterium]